MKYIPADKLIAEIERLKQDNETSNDKEYAQYELDVACGYAMACEEFLSLIDSLQQEHPEVDLKKEIEKELDTRWKGEYLSTSKFRESARHFYKLGLNARKEE